jgi:Rod binding domain-containing protein
MSSDLTIPSLPGGGLDVTSVPSAHKTDSPEKIKDAASQFEALLIGQILKAAHEESDGGWGGDSDPASASAMDFANDYFARAMASKGGLGLSHMIVNGLERQGTKAPSTEPAN